MAPKKPKVVRDNSLFVFLNWILQKRPEPQDITIPPVFMTSRWLSMSDPSCASIVNGTLNRWIGKSSIGLDPKLAGKFCRVLMPKTNKRFSYIKKPERTEDSAENVTDVAKAMELSEREVSMYNQLVEKLNLQVK